MTQTPRPQPGFKPYKKHVFVCTGTKCAPEESPELYSYLKRRLKELGLEGGVERIERSQCRCLGICSGGPLVVVYPDSIWYYQVDTAALERILQEHILRGEPVKEKVLYSPSLTGGG